MLRRIVCCVLCGLFASSSSMLLQKSAHGAIGARLILQGTGSNAEGAPDNNSFPIDRSFSLNNGPLSESALVQSYGFNGGLASFTSRGSVYADDGSIGAFVEGTANGGWVGGPEAGGTAQVDWYDNVSVVWNGSGTAPASFTITSLVMSFVVEGIMQSSPYATQLSAAYFDFQPGTAYWVSTGFTADLGTSFSFEDSVQGIIPLVNSSGSFQYRVRAFASTPAGLSRSDALHTMRLAAVTLADGTTPESHGYSLVFASGMQSPNLQSAPVPEPRSLAMWSGVAALVSIGCVCRRRATVSTNPYGRIR